MKKLLLSFCLLAACAMGLAAQTAPGTYMLYCTDEATPGFAVRNGAWGTQVVLDMYGQPIQLTVQDQEYTLKMWDAAGDERAWFPDGSGSVFSDGASNTAWVIDGTALKNVATGKYLVIKQRDGIYYPEASADSKDQAANWAFLGADEYKAIVEKQAVNQVNDILGLKIGMNHVLTSMAELDEGQFAWTEANVSIDAEAGEAYQPAGDNNSNIDNSVVRTSFSFTAPEPGLYRVMVPAMYRWASASRTFELAQMGMDYNNCRIYTSDYIAPVPGISAGMTTDNVHSQSSTGTADGVTYYWPNGQDGFAGWASAGQYLTPVYAYAAKAGERVEVKIQSRIGRIWCANWLVYNPPLCKVYILTGGLAADLTDFNAAVAEIQGKFGFGRGQCAPYLNVEACQTLDEALAADLAFRQPLVDDYTAKLKAASAAMTINAKDMDAVYNGDFTQPLAGWASSTGQNGISIADGRAVMHFDGNESSQTTAYSYGSASTAYAMPLVEGEEYVLRISYGAWGVTPRDSRISLIDAAGRQMANKITIPQDIKAGGTPSSLEAKFTPSASGNCLLTVSNPGASESAEFNNCLAINSVSIMLATAAPVDPGKEGIQVTPTDSEEADAPAAYYNLQGVRIAQPVPGQPCIMLQGGKATKILTK